MFLTLFIAPLLPLLIVTLADAVIFFAAFTLFATPCCQQVLTPSFLAFRLRRRHAATCHAEAFFSVSCITSVATFLLASFYFDFSYADIVYTYTFTLIHIAAVITLHAIAFQMPCCLLSPRCCHYYAIFAIFRYAIIFRFLLMMSPSLMLMADATLFSDIFAARLFIRFIFIDSFLSYMPLVCC